MPAGDTGLERQTADAEYRTICGWVTTYGWLNAAMAERVRQLLHRQQAVVDAARWSITGTRRAEHEQCGKSCIWRRLIDALAALDKAQAAQPEDERG